MNGRHRLFVATEGLPFLLSAASLTAIAWFFGGAGTASAPFALFVYLYLVFRDPERDISPAPLGVVSPVDGKVIEIAGSQGLLEGEARRIIIRVTSFGTYTARSPVEGKIMDLHGLSPPRSTDADAAGLWVVTDEGNNVVLQFRGNRFGIAPRAFLRYGERVGQGQRCAYLRLTKFAELQLPIDSRVLVTEGQRVSAGRDLLAKLPQP